MRCLQKLQRCGNANHFTIPRVACLWLGWLPGEAFIFETLEDKSVRIRKPTPDDFAPKNPPRLVVDNSLPPTP